MRLIVMRAIKLTFVLCPFFFILSHSNTNENFQSAAWSGIFLGFMPELLSIDMDVLKVSKSRKKYIVFWILPKNERWGNFQYIKLPKRSFFERIEDTIFFEIY